MEAGTDLCIVGHGGPIADTPPALSFDSRFLKLITVVMKGSCKQEPEAEDQSLADMAGRALPGVRATDPAAPLGTVLRGNGSAWAVFPKAGPTVSLDWLCELGTRNLKAAGERCAQRRLVCQQRRGEARGDSPVPKETEASCFEPPSLSPP